MFTFKLPTISDFLVKQLVEEIKEPEDTKETKEPEDIKKKHKRIIDISDSESDDDYDDYETAEEEDDDVVKKEEVKVKQVEREEKVEASTKDKNVKSMVYINSKYHKKEKRVKKVTIVGDIIVNGMDNTLFDSLNADISFPGKEGAMALNITMTTNTPTTTTKT